MVPIYLPSLIYYPQSIMAKEKKIAVKKEAPKKEEKEIVLNLDTFIVPLSIVLAGIIIAVAILLTNNGKNSNSNTNNDTAGDTANAEEFTATEVNIDDDAYLGDKSKAKIAIVEFSDYECPYCQRHFKETNQKLIDEYVNTGKAILVFRDFPLSFHDPKATREAIAAECVGDLGGNEAYFKFHDLVFTNTPTNGVGLEDSVLAGYATQAGVSADKFNACLTSEKFKDEVAEDLADGQKAGVQGTPGFIVGTLDKDGNVKGKLIAGAYPFDSFKQIIEEYL